jgi:alanine racemase
VGADPADAAGLAAAVDRSHELWLEGLCTHLAVADEPDNPFTAEQLSRFADVVVQLADAGIRAAMLHACNSAGAITQPAARYDLVRCGVALYGLAPSLPLVGACSDLRPALALKARVSYVRQVEAGEGLSYGLRYRLDRDSVVATIPIGYADGVPRRLADNGAEVLIGGRRRPIAGSVTMDQITVDCGDDQAVAVGDEVVLLGAQGQESIGAWEWAQHLDTIAYEVTCGISARVPRVYLPA